MDLSSDKKTIYTGGSDGTVTAWDPESGNNQRIGGSGHGAQIIQIKGIKLIKLISNLKICMLELEAIAASHRFKHKSLQ